MPDVKVAEEGEGLKAIMAVLEGKEEKGAVKQAGGEEVVAGDMAGATEEEKAVELEGEVMAMEVVAG